MRVLSISVLSVLLLTACDTHYVKNPSGQKPSGRGKRVIAQTYSIEPNADLVGADLSNQNLLGVDLSGARLWHANLNGADLRKANLRGADLWTAHLIGADLRDADLSGANLSETVLHAANLHGAIVSGTKMHCIKYAVNSGVLPSGYTSEVDNECSGDWPSELQEENPYTPKRVRIVPE